eukprot:TRINITY_DN106502_c0_g1_i1.p2 TRINITY_DN106502_c0_g1~~TRINITY_DN106502_c0_g1_i1.p2  ORF type:complete len:115 (+),score=21.75 TRINITY_DN106502_c0_g1_i1:52-396(+)
MQPFFEHIANVVAEYEHLRAENETLRAAQLALSAQETEILRAAQLTPSAQENEILRAAQPTPSAQGNELLRAAQLAPSAQDMKHRRCDLLVEQHEEEDGSGRVETRSRGDFDYR